MRQIVLDTETTGLEPGLGHRIIEIGCVELAGRARGEQQFHRYINPERDSDLRAQEVHQLSRQFLSDKPKFAEIAQAFLAFVDGAELLIHNAPFDVSFINAEFARVGLGLLEQYCTITDTYALARAHYPGQRNGLDALCKRLDVDNSSRTAHGALLDANLLADVYLAMTRGQNALSFGYGGESASVVHSARDTPIRVSLLRRLASADELGLHAVRLSALEKSSKGNCLWLQLDAASSQ
jgi:DNA polymerase III subunit epsilon